MNISQLQNNTDKPDTTKPTIRFQQKSNEHRNISRSSEQMLASKHSDSYYHRIDEIYYAHLTASKLPPQPRALLGIVLSLTHSYNRSSCTVETNALLASIGIEPTTATRRALMNHFRKLEDSGYIEFTKESRTILEITLQPVERWSQTNAWTPFLDKGDIYSKVPKGLFGSLYKMSPMISSASQAMYLSVLRLTSLYRRKSSAITKTTLSRMCGLSKASIARATSILVSLGLIEANQVHSRVVYTPTPDACNGAQPSNKNKTIIDVDKSQNQPLIKATEDPNSDLEDPNSDLESANSDTPFNNKYNKNYNYDSLCESEKTECGKQKPNQAAKPVCLDKIKSSLTKKHLIKIESLGLNSNLEFKKMVAWYKRLGNPIKCYTSTIELWLARAEEYILNKRSQAKRQPVRYNSNPRKSASFDSGRTDSRDSVEHKTASLSAIELARAAAQRWTGKTLV